MEYRLMGMDRFDGEFYYISTRPYKASYPTYAEAKAAASARLNELEEYQPSRSSGGQGGIQDWVYILHPDGHRERRLSL
jgi:hypothetical protein